MTPTTVIVLARQFLFVREAQTLGQNRGQRVEAIQRWSGGVPGDSWCAQFATMVLDIAYQGKSPILRTGSCQEIYDLAKKNRWVRAVPSVGDLYLYVNEAGHAHHVGIASGVNPLVGIAGNTSRDGKSSNGDGVYEHEITKPINGEIVFVRYSDAL